jgi:hypothetical protein
MLSYFPEKPFDPNLRIWVISIVPTPYKFVTSVLIVEGLFCFIRRALRQWLPIKRSVRQILDPPASVSIRQVILDNAV